MGMKESGLGKSILGCFLCSSPSSSSSSSSLKDPWRFFCINAMEGASSHDSEDELERRPLVKSGGGRVMRLKDVLLSDDDEFQTLAFPLKPKFLQTVTLRVSMHCGACARKVEKHIAKMDGVMSYKVYLESKMVIVIGDVFPHEVLQSVSKVKKAELWSPPESTAPAMAIPTNVI